MLRGVRYTFRPSIPDMPEAGSAGRAYSRSMNRFFVGLSGRVGLTRSLLCYQFWGRSGRDRR